MTEMSETDLDRVRRFVEPDPDKDLPRLAEILHSMARMILTLAEIDARLFPSGPRERKR